jgi:predicted Zn-dependent peptidase
MYELTTLDNGLRLLTVTMPHVQSVSLGFFMNVGSRYESEAVAGASHFIEHMLFKGTARYPTAREIADAIEGRGGVFNASTGPETTLYWAKVAAANLPQTLAVLGDMLLNATFDAAEMEKERAVIVEEINYSLDAPDSLVQMLVNELQWPNHPLGRDVAGTRESVEGLSRASLVAYLGDLYLPGNTVLGLAGQVSHEEAVNWAKAYLKGWQPGPPTLYEPAALNHRGSSLQLETKDIEQTHLSFSFAALSRSDPDRYALRLLNVLLGEGMSSRLFQEVRERLGLAYNVESFVSTYQDTGAIGVYAGVATERVEESIRAILGQLDRLRQEPMPQDELDKAREFIKGRLILSLEDSFTVAAWYSRQMLLGPEVLHPEEVIARFDAIQPADIQRLAQRLFQPDQQNLAIVGPIPADDDRFRQAMHF